MTIDETTVRRIARLARVRIDENQAHALQGELTSILDWVEQLGEVDTADVAPMTGMSVPTDDGGTAAAKSTPHTPLRDDVVTAGGDPEAVLSNAPQRADNFFAVPKIVE